MRETMPGQPADDRESYESTEAETTVAETRAEERARRVNTMRQMDADAEFSQAERRLRARDRKTDAYREAERLLGGDDPEDAA